MQAVCGWVGVSCPEVSDYGSVKTFCPFGLTSHSDRGAEQALRVYADSNSAFCFSEKMIYTPVSMAAKAWDRAPRDVAADLLERIGYKPATLAQEWQRATSKETVVDKASLGLALRTYADRIDPYWVVKQFSPEVAPTLSGCLSLLDKVASEEDAVLWLSTCKLVLGNCLGKE